MKRHRREHSLEHRRAVGLEAEPVPKAVTAPGTSLPIPAGASTETDRVSLQRRKEVKGRLGELFSDAVIATGAALVLFSVGLLVLILVAALPGGNPYIGVFLFVLLPIIAVGGFLVFLFGVVLDSRRGDFFEEEAAEGEGRQTQEEESGP